MSFSGESTQFNADYLGGITEGAGNSGNTWNISTGSSKLSAGGLLSNPLVLIGGAAVVLAAVFLLKRRR